MSNQTVYNNLLPQAASTPLSVDAVAALGCLPPGANVCVAAPANQIGNRYSYGYNDDVGVECHEHYAKLGGGCNYVMQTSRRIRFAM